MDSTMREAIRLRDRLLDVAKELRLRRDGLPELNKLDAQSCDDSAQMLQKLGTEVTRLREGIGHFEYGMMSRHDLIQMPRRWNEVADPPSMKDEGHG